GRPRALAAARRALDPPGRVGGGPGAAGADPGRGVHRRPGRRAHRRSHPSHRLRRPAAADVHPGHLPRPALDGVELAGPRPADAGAVRLFVRVPSSRHLPGGPGLLAGVHRRGRGGAPVRYGGLRGVPAAGAPGAHVDQGIHPPAGKEVAETPPAGVSCCGAGRAALPVAGEEGPARPADLRRRVRRAHAGAAGAPAGGGPEPRPACAARNTRPRSSV
ncbi:MAG: Protein-methionine-sulfoxide reductase heme-binding subunit MsrQ, partial [uncultured Gemmatimonadetes bacterium]